MTFDPSDHPIHIIQITTGVLQFSNGVEWKPIILQNLGNTRYLNSVFQCLFAIGYSTSYLPANTESPLINIFNEFTENKKEFKD